MGTRQLALTCVTNFKAVSIAVAYMQRYSNDQEFIARDITSRVPLTGIQVNRDKREFTTTWSANHTLHVLLIYISEWHRALTTRDSYMYNIAREHYSNDCSLVPNQLSATQSLTNVNQFVHYLEK